MPRPLASPKQHGRAYDLYRAGLGPTAIFDKLDGEFEDPVSPRTVSNWMRGFRELKDSVVARDSPFEWHRMEEYGLPWEASRWLLDLWSVQTHGGRPLPTVREVQWWWRAYQAAGDLPTGNWSTWDAFQIAKAFISRELAHDLLGEPMHVADLELLVAVRPWESDELKQDYYERVEEEPVLRVQGNPLRRDFPSDLSADVRFTLSIGSFEVFWPDSGYPHMLASQAWQHRKAERIKRSRRTA